MGDNKAATLAKAMVELEEMYSGIPDESVDLTFQHLANLKQNPNNNSQDHHNHHQNNNMESTIIPHQNMTNSTTLLVSKLETNLTPLRKLPSLDFTKGLEATKHHHIHHHGSLDRINEDSVVNHPLRGANHHHDHHGDQHSSMNSHHSCIANSGFRRAVESTNATVGLDIDAMSGRSVAYSAYQEKATVGRRRPGIPHTKICALCSTYTYFFRHRCLVCGRAYCRQCVGIGMGEMTEGRKCIECLGRRFSQRYIQRAGEEGCFCSRYPIAVRQAELKWAEKGPRKKWGEGLWSQWNDFKVKKPNGPKNSNCRPC